MKIAVRVNKSRSGNLLVTEILKPASVGSTQSRFKKTTLCEIKTSFCSKFANIGIEQTLNKRHFQANFCKVSKRPTFRDGRFSSKKDGVV